MSLASSISALAQAIGLDIKALFARSLPPGGSAGQVLSKASSADYATAWVNNSGAGTYTAGTGLTLSGGEFRITNTAVTAGSYGSASQTLSATVNAQGQLTALSAQSIAIANTQVSGLGTMSTQNANGVAITGGSITNLSTFDGVTIDGGTF
jgi:hypothetical protein